MKPASPIPTVRRANISWAKPAARPLATVATDQIAVASATMRGCVTRRRAYLTRFADGQAVTMKDDAMLRNEKCAVYFSEHVEQVTAMRNLAPR